jgi:hypothetical protein
MSIQAQFDKAFGIASARFDQGAKDCAEGIPAQSDDECYLNGYRAQYEREQKEAELCQR